MFLVSVLTKVATRFFLLNWKFTDRFKFDIVTNGNSIGRTDMGSRWPRSVQAPACWVTIRSRRSLRSMGFCWLKQLKLHEVYEDMLQDPGFIIRKSHTARSVGEFLATIMGMSVGWRHSSCVLVRSNNQDPPPLTPHTYEVHSGKKNERQMPNVRCLRQRLITRRSPTTHERIQTLDAQGPPKRKPRQNLGVGAYLWRREHQEISRRAPKHNRSVRGLVSIPLQMIFF